MSHHATARPANLRLAVRNDAAAILAIYNYEVERTTATFDLTPRSFVQQEEWILARSQAFAAIVATDADDKVIGFASLSPYKERAAYRTSVENSVYVDRSVHGRGVGRQLLTAILDQAAEHGFHAVFARIEASGSASRALHVACGFTLIGVEREVGRKFGRWLDVALMQCLLHERTAL